MPNHVDNDLTIRGSKEDVEAFFKAVGNTVKSYDGQKFIPIDHNKIIPYPKHFADADAKADEARKRGDYSVKDGYNAGGYEWCLKNWGTKWGLYDFSEVEELKTGAKLSFQSAWSPAIPIFKKMSEMFPSLTFTIKYFEGGMGFQGKIKLKGGEVLEETSGSYRGNRGG